jgi:PKD repeat protein
VEIDRMRRGWLVGSTVVGLWALACSNSPTGGGNEVGVIGPAGGAVTLGTEARIDVPAGALSEEVLIRILPVATPADLQAQGAIGQAYRFEPVNQTFITPARISIHVPPVVLAGRSLDQVTILRSTAAGNALAPAGEELASIARSPDGTISGNTTRLGVFSAAIINQEPTADAGSDRTVAVGSVVTLTGSATDPDGDALDFAWSFVSRPPGSSAEIINPGTAAASFLADEPGIFELHLTVADQAGNTATDTVRITATASTGNRAPVADAGPDQSALVGQTVTLDGSGSIDPDGTALVFSWRFLTGSVASPPIVNASQARATFVPTTSGTYVVELTVSDGSLSSTDTMTITVGTTNRAPTITVNAPEAVIAGTTADIAVAAVDPDGDPVTFSFELVSAPSGSSADIVDVGGGLGRLRTDVIGPYEARVTASDGRSTVSDTITVWGNPGVAGTYDTTFTIASAIGCGSFLTPGSVIRPMIVTQPVPGRVVFELTALSPNIKSDPTLTLQGTGLLFNGAIVVGNDSGTVNAQGGIAGTIDGQALDTTFRFTAFSCQVLGTITGQRQP